MKVKKKKSKHWTIETEAERDTRLANLKRMMIRRTRRLDALRRIPDGTYCTECQRAVIIQFLNAMTDEQRIEWLKKQKRQ